MTYSTIFHDQTVLVTGGTGSFGQAFVRRLLEQNQCRKVIIFSRDEWKQWEMSQSDPIFSHPKIRYFLGDVRDKNRLLRAFHEVDIVVHAAALKQVPAAEYNPTEFIKTNVNGAENIINAALDSNVKKVIALSTDKAVNPVNLYGATKLCADKLFVAANAYTGIKGYPIFSVVRYGNVIASRGSIIARWKQMIAEGAKALPITDERMTRFWITLDDSVTFVERCCADARGGEIYVPKIPSMKIVDLAKALAPDLPLTKIGIRPGEKLHELMVPSELSWLTREYDDYYMIVPGHAQKNYLEGREGKPLPEGFAYTSDRNEKWLTVEALRSLILTG